MTDLIKSFKSQAKKAKSYEEIVSVMEAVEERRSVLMAENDNLYQITKRLDKRKSKMDLDIHFPTEADYTPENFMTLQWMEVKQPMYDKVTNWFHKSYKYIWLSGLHPETGQASISLTFKINEPVEPQIAEVMEFLPFVIPYKNEYMEEEAKVFSILTGEEGNPHVQIRDDKVEIRYGYNRTRLHKEFNSLEACLTYIHSTSRDD